MEKIPYFILALLISLVAGEAGFSSAVIGVQNIRGSRYKALAGLLFGPGVLIAAFLLLKGMAGPIPIAIAYLITLIHALYGFTHRLKVRGGVLVRCDGDGTDAVIPGGVTGIAGWVFKDHFRLLHVTIPDSVRAIGSGAFSGCGELRSVTIPAGVRSIEAHTFSGCRSLTSVIIPEGAGSIGEGAFAACAELKSVTVPESVVRIHPEAFKDCPKLTVICTEGSYAHRYCLEHDLSFIFDYQFEAFHGLLPPGFEKLASPFLADEEKPYIFISYSHKDRDTVLPILRDLYEEGWRVWYDEGLTIGDCYDETLEARVRGCAAFLLFVSRNSLNSFYCRENEIPWAVDAARPVIKCVLERGKDLDIPGGSVIGTVDKNSIPQALERVDGLMKGERRTAKGITVVVDPLARDGAGGDGFAYGLYSASGSVTARAILLEARNNGCAVYDAAEQGPDEDKLRNCACLVVFLDKAFLADKGLTDTLLGAYRSGRDMAVCQLEAIGDEDLPQELIGLHKMQWLNYAFGINADMNTKLARHLQKRGCRDTAALPGFKYEKTDEGIVITRYTGMDPEPRIESGYGGTPVIEIADHAFANCACLKNVVIPENVVRIGNGAFENCGNLLHVTLPGSLVSIGEGAFALCVALTSVTIPEKVTRISAGLFRNCGGLKTVALPENVTQIGDGAFKGCEKLDTVNIPSGISRIGKYAFEGCEDLKAFPFPEGITRIEEGSFKGCFRLRSFTLPDSLLVIGDSAFEGCYKPASLTLPGCVTSIGPFAFKKCSGLKSVTLPDSLLRMGEGAFEACMALGSIVIPGGVREIEKGVFKACEKIRTAALPDGLVSIGDEAFCYCHGLTSVNIPAGVTSIGAHAFDRCFTMKSLFIPDSVTDIGEMAFYGCDKSFTVLCPPHSHARDYCLRNGIRSGAPASR